jgi:hypothetical protein
MGRNSLVVSLGIEVLMSNNQSSAVAALRDFLTAMRDWEFHYYGRYRAALSDEGGAKHLGAEMCNAKREVIAQWCSLSVLANASSSPSVGDPPAFDPDRDDLTVQEASENKVVILHTQRAGLESVHRFGLVAEHGRWVVAYVQILEDDSPPVWAPMIL